MDYRAQAEDRAERYEAALHGRVFSEFRAAGVSSALFFKSRNRRCSLSAGLTLDCCCARSGTALTNVSRRFPVLGDDYIG